MIIGSTLQYYLINNYLNDKKNINLHHTFDNMAIIYVLLTIGVFLSTN